MGKSRNESLVEGECIAPLQGLLQQSESYHSYVGLDHRTIRYRHPTVLLNLYNKSLVRPHLDY